MYSLVKVLGSLGSHVLRGLGMLLLLSELRTGAAQGLRSAEIWRVQLALRVHLRVSMCVYIYVERYNCVQIRIYVYIHVYIYIHMCMYMYVHTCIHTDIHAYARLR